jgi:uncharacterized FAD-dependent dehydrogenase
MPFLLRNLTLNLGEGDELLPLRLMDRFSLTPEDLLSLSVARKAIDARKKPNIKFVYTRVQSVLPKLRSDKRILIAGMGPAGIFAGLRLAEYGLTPAIVERGKPVAERVRDVAEFWRRGSLDPESNVQFGEGGAGTFSDGKLTTRIRDANSGYVLEKLVRFGAPPEILQLAKPHIGTDRLRRVLINIRSHLETNGLAVRFREKLTDIFIGDGELRGVAINDRTEEPCDILVLAPGHSARDTYAMLERRGVRLERKPFAVGVRVEHPQELINRIQYGLPDHPQLPPAEYFLTWNDRRTGRSAYSFCMCPGGIVVAGASEEGGVVTNGMSDYRRDSLYANSALVVTVGVNDFTGDSPLAGIEFQRRLERAAFTAGGGGYRAPAQNIMNFMGDRGGFRLSSTYRPGVREAALDQILPDYVSTALREGLRNFDRRMRGFISAEATLTGVETRTSAPVRILRGRDLQSVTLPGLYPAGEGAGYAGGIMSAALDGIRVADVIARKLQADS